MSRFSKRNKIIGVLGVKGSGKSTFCKGIFATAPRVLVIDTMGEYNLGVQISSPLQLVQYLQRTDRFKICCLPIEESDFEFYCEAIRLKQSSLLIVEEVSQYSTHTFTPPEFRKCVQLGRHALLNILYTSQRFADIPRRLTSQTDEYVFFRQTEPRDLDAIDARFPGLSDQVSHLPDFSFLRKKVGEVQDAHCIVDSLGSTLVHCD